MDISQVINLATWYSTYSDEFVDKYNQLSSVLDHNAQQPQKQPVREPLQILIDTLEGLPIEELTNEELSKLDELGVRHYLGFEGAEFVTNSVTSGEYDPASSASDIKLAIQALTQKNNCSMLWVSHSKTSSSNKTMTKS